LRRQNSTAKFGDNEISPPYFAFFLALKFACFIQRGAQILFDKFQKYRKFHDELKF